MHVVTLRRVGGGLSTYEFVGPVEAVQARDRYGSLVRLAADDPGVGSVRLVRIDYLPGGATESELSRWDRPFAVSPERLAEIAAIPDEAIDTSDVPEAPGDWFSRTHPLPRFTRGPWFRDESLDGVAWSGSLAVAALGPEGDPVILASTARGFSPEEAEANATLMASAQRLYSTLSTAVDLIDGMVVGTRMMRGETDLRVEPTPLTDALRRVLAEARGERVGVARRETPSPAVPRPLAEWGEADADVLWWRFPVDEPPYVGSPLSSDWPGHHTHWTRIVVPAPPTRREGGGPSE